MRHTSDAGCFSSDGEIEILHLINISGKPGQHGKRGKNYPTPPMQPGARGMHGGAAGPSERGHDADAINLHLCHAGEPQKRILRISGTVQKDASEHQLAVEEIEITPD
ncbi:hypothetical protein OAG82_04225, partial [Rubripirellula sp.]